MFYLMRLWYNARMSDTIFLKEQVFEKRPALREILQDWGSVSLLEYARNHAKNPIQQDDQRYQEFTNAVAEEGGSDQIPPVENEKEDIIA